MDADCIDDCTKKCITGCDSVDAPTPAGQPEVDDNYCWPWAEYDNDMEVFRDCCNEAKNLNILDNKCVCLWLGSSRQAGVRA
jgi:hypothetical protein